MPNKENRLSIHHESLCRGREGGLDQLETCIKRGLWGVENPRRVFRRGDNVTGRGGGGQPSHAPRDDHFSQSRGEERSRKEDVVEKGGGVAVDMLNLVSGPQWVHSREKITR